MENKEIIAIAQSWLSGNYDKDTKEKVQALIDGDPVELKDAFYQNLEFGTGGLRGIMGVGTNRMNIYTVGMATQGLSNYVKKHFAQLSQIKVAVSHDSRNNSRLFAQTVANVFSANGFKVYLFEDMRPTPELSFAIRQLGCQSGVMVTASHNPKEYNGYKAYWNDGAQLIHPHDSGVMNEVVNIKSIDEVKWQGIPENIETIGKEIDDIYIAKVKSLSLAPEIIKKHKDLKIVYTPLHGTGARIVPRVLTAFGFENVNFVEEQMIPNGDFPTVKSPNPEERATMQMAIDKAKTIDADIVLATDPDADRVGIAVKKADGDFMLFNGNQTGSLLIYYVLSQWKALNKFKGNEYIIKTIVTTELIKTIAESFGVESFDCLTGFKYIADVIAKNEGKKTFIVGGEESYGYLAGEFVRDKDAMIACSLIAEAAAWAADQGKTLIDILNDIYLKYGFYKEDMQSITKKGFSGIEEIKNMMKDFRKNHPSELAGSKVVCVKDYQNDTCKNSITGVTEKMNFPASDVLQFYTENGSKVTVRPSGTEPKIKFYFGLKEKINTAADIEQADKEATAKIDAIKKSLNLQ